MEYAPEHDSAVAEPVLNGDIEMPDDGDALHTKLNGTGDASDEVGSPIPAETQPDDGAEAPPMTNGSDNSMMDVETPATTPGMHDTADSTFVGSVNGTSSYTTPNDIPADQTELDDDSQPPPAKRLRTHSDADLASLAHSASPPPQSNPMASNGTTPKPEQTEPLLTPPAISASAGPSQPPPPSTINAAQFRFCQSTVRTLKKLKDAGPFLRPVDPVLLNIPHYPTVVKNPMDLGTVERKLNSSNPSKPDPNPDNPRYYSAEEFTADVRLIFSNCLAFNGPEHAVTQMGKRVEEVFDKAIKNMPSAEPKPSVVKKVSTPPPPPPPAAIAAPAKKVQARRQSTSLPVIRRSEQEAQAVSRPKREIHPPPPKDLPYADAPKKPRKSKRPKDAGAAEQLKFCLKMLQDLNRKQHYDIAHPFYEPVDWQKLELPTYPKIVKRPMDLWTMRKKLDAGEYPNAEAFYQDFKLMIRNCFAFNPAGTPVNQAGIDLQRLFDERWKGLPPLRQEVSEDEEDEEDESEDEDRIRAIAKMEAQMESLRGSIEVLKNSKAPKEKKKKPKADKMSGVSKPTKNPKPSGPPKKKNKAPIASDDVLTFEQKKDLSDAISQLEGQKLEKVISMIHDAVPEIKDSNEEIELEIDMLPPSVLMKLYHFVIKPQKPAPTKRSRGGGKGTGTGGLKRKSMDEDVEAEKIRKLEQRMKLFEQGGNGDYAAPMNNGNDSGSSDSGSSDDSSGSDSE